MTAYALAKLCYDTLLEYGVTAKMSCEAHAVTPALEHIVEANTLLSGLGFESGGLAAAHAIHNGLTVSEKVHDQYHGEKVAFGTLASLFLTDKPRSVIDEVYTFCESVGLPTYFERIGLGDVSDEELMEVAVVPLFYHDRRRFMDVMAYCIAINGSFSIPRGWCRSMC